MLKYEMFSNFYRNKKRDKDSSGQEKHEIQGSLAVAPKVEADLPIARRTSRTWWESGWQQKR